MSKYTLTEEHRAQLKPWSERWINIALRTEPQTEEEKKKVRMAMRGLYAAADLEAPSIEVFCASPVSGAMAASIAAGVWYLRENKDAHHDLFGEVVSPEQIEMAMRMACCFAAMGSDPVLKEASDLPLASERVHEIVATILDAATQATGSQEADVRATLARFGEQFGGLNRSQPEAQIVRFLLHCMERWYSLRDGGNQWVGWPAFISFFQDVAKLQIPEYEKFNHYRTLAELAGPRFMHGKFWMVSDFPTTIGRDDRNRSHCDTGPAIAWSDGWKSYSIHGVTVPPHVVEQPELITPAAIEEETNAEVRRVMLSRYGEGRYLQEVGGSLIQSDEFGDLFQVDRPNDTPLTMVRVSNSTPEPDGTKKVYWLRCHHELRPLMLDAEGQMRLGEPQEMTAKNAVASTFGLRGEQYSPQQES